MPECSQLLTAITPNLNRNLVEASFLATLTLADFSTGKIVNKLYEIPALALNP
jgi:hypothetical protein